MAFSLSVFFFFSCYGYHRDLNVSTHSAPTRRSSDVLDLLLDVRLGELGQSAVGDLLAGDDRVHRGAIDGDDGADRPVVGELVLGSVAVQLAPRPIPQLGRAGLPAEGDTLAQSVGERRRTIKRAVLDLDRKSTRLNSSH